MYFLDFFFILHFQKMQVDSTNKDVDNTTLDVYDFDKNEQKKVMIRYARIARSHSSHYSFVFDIPLIILSADDKAFLSL